MPWSGQRAACPCVPGRRWTDTFNERCYLLALLRRQFPDRVQGGQSSVIFYVDVNS